ncbi:hypothetical protein VC83_09348 [Pseudogymnoascus destructans]|uniref:Uncharacterized protein n=1 Tax=Pseudogymnoascus destructans TaxID=655981 RepID=A0A176ZWY7_9PEZI|nr:uncharacterized protein VC83_09348 [Pseudogymnoascus destructans]OAF54297.1 hypothetical protein VC83_09348 [Pseudogymnoascus destructans]
MAGRELDDAERLERPVRDNEVWEREVGGCDLIRHSVAAAWRIGMAEAAGRQVEDVECPVVVMRLERAFDEAFMLLRNFD